MLSKKAASLSNYQKFLPLTATIALFFTVFGFGAAAYEQMRDPQIFLNLFVSSPYLLISAVGSTFVILSGGIDLSVSGVIALTTVASAALLRTEQSNPWVVMLLMLAMGMTIGAVMGYFITYLKVQPFIATLAGQWFARGMCFFISDDAISIDDRIWRIFGQTKILIPGLADPVAKTGAYITILVVVALLIFAAAIYIAQSTRFGRTVYAIGGNNGGNEHSARLMGLQVNRTKMLVYILNGFCSALAGIVLSMYVSSGHGLYAGTFEMTVIAAVVIGGTMLSGGEGFIFGTLFGVLITGLIQTLIQFNGRLSSWWTSIIVGLLTLVFIGVQSFLAARKSRRLASQKRLSQIKTAAPFRQAWPRRRQILSLGGGAFAVIVLAVVVTAGLQNANRGSSTQAASTTSAACQLQPFRTDAFAGLINQGAVLVYERNGGSGCIDELFGVFADGRIQGDNGAGQVEKQITPKEVEDMLAGIDQRGWYTADMYSTSHTPCGECFSYSIHVFYQGKEKIVKAVDGGTDAPANFWQVVSIINGVIPKLAPAQ